MRVNSYNADNAPLSDIQSEIDAIDNVCYEIWHLAYMSPERIRMSAKLYDRIATEMENQRVTGVCVHGKSLNIRNVTVSRTCNLFGAPWKIVVTPVNNKGDKRWRE